MIGWNGELTVDDIKYLKDFQNRTSDTLNYLHNHPNSKSISIGRLINEAYQDDPYSLHNCSILPDSSGSIILDCYHRLADIHVGISNSKKNKKVMIYLFTDETYNMFLLIQNSLKNLLMKQSRSSVTVPVYEP